jgi:hypothetical protein
MKYLVLAITIAIVLSMDLELKQVHHLYYLSGLRAYKTWSKSSNVRCTWELLEMVEE